MSDMIYLSKVRLSFPHLVEPHAAGGNPTAPKKYSADFIMDAEHPGYKEFMATYLRLAQGKWGEHANQVMQLIQSDRKLRCYGKGDEKIDKKSFQPYSGYAGKMFISANKIEPPQMIEQNGNPIDPANTMARQATARKLYGGCYVNAAIKPWVQENAHGRGIRCDLIAVQFAEDGEAFGEASVDASTMFGSVAGGQATPQSSVDMPSSPFPGDPSMPSFLG
jgi:hypothetical protein